MMNAILSKTGNAISTPWVQPMRGLPEPPPPTTSADGSKPGPPFNFAFAVFFSASLFIAAALTAYVLRVSPAVPLSEPPPGDAGRAIAFLIGQVRRSPASFLQHGANEPARALAAALEAKAEQHHGAIATTEEFIQLAFGGSDSEFAAYEIRHMDGSRETCAAWLKRVLRAYRLTANAERPADLTPSARAKPAR